jgi:hypothetical protein
MARVMIHNLPLPQAPAPNKRLVHFAGSRASTHSTPNPPCSHAAGKQENRLLGGPAATPPVSTNFERYG